jgi:histidyl-tRNA synthetase
VLGGGRSLKAQLRHAASLGVPFVAILGERELSSGSVTLRDMRSSEQREIPLSDVPGALNADP